MKMKKCEVCSKEETKDNKIFTSSRRNTKNGEEIKSKKVELCKNCLDEGWNLEEKDGIRFS